MVTLCPLGMQFFEDYLRMLNSKEVERFTSPSDSKKFTQTEIKDWLSGKTRKGKRYDFAILNENKDFVGEVVFNHFNEDRCNFRIALLPEFFEKSYGTAATRKACDFIFKETKIKEIHLDVFAINPRARHVYSKVGFVESDFSTDENGDDTHHMILTKERFKQVKY